MTRWETCSRSRTQGGKTSFTYDGMNRLLTTIDPLGKADSRTYDFDGNLVKFVDRRGQTSQFSYDSLNRLTGETYQDSKVARSYDVLGRLVHVNDSTGGVFDFTYDSVGRLLGRPISSVQCRGACAYLTLGWTTLMSSETCPFAANTSSRPSRFVIEEENRKRQRFAPTSCRSRN